ncbi:DnaJ domain-containing protein [Gaeumannomyces tritici R3-111a-1]|uniref:DnaJ domain-containing protein n=1 Tax=Gaeumannomyces tritici (strain R3-111a-1) TaxID=644352 RepID=J3P778_GAET3|nr:DnaJ domain-containing protein [Gaeumannomyces tritici R3-111a-1]EJT72509.1 DnaJ domain-containing protein [Gaeumannomyces tritici R3-111a-1]
MKISTLSLGLLALLTPFAAAWNKEDREIFRVRDELIAGEGQDVTFYDYLGVKPAASVDDISKAYRQKSRQLHPDKVKQQLTAERARAAKAKDKNKKKKPPTHAEVKAAIKKASDRQARLSIVANILRGPSRDRYDHFLSNGFPSWKGADYYYNRYRPGLGTAMFGVFLVGGGLVHYLIMYMNWKRQQEFVGRYIKFARQTAWGDSLDIPGVEAAISPPSPPPAAAAAESEEQQAAMPMNRKQRRFQERETRREATKGSAVGGGRRRKAFAASGSATPTQQSSGPTGAKKRVVAENGKVLVVDSLGDVYLEEQDEDGNLAEFLLDPNEMAKPTIKDTALFRLPIWAYRSTAGRILGGNKDYEALPAEDIDDEPTPADDDDSSEPGKRTPSTDSAEDFELLEKSTDSLGEAKSAQGKGNKSASKRKQKKK